MDILEERIKLHLGISDEIYTIVIWGAGQFGELIYNLLASKWPQHKILGYVDSSVKQVTFKGQAKIFPISELTSMEYDLLFISSIEYESEIEAQLNSLDIKLPGKAIKLTEIPDLLLLIQELHASRDYQKTKNLIYRFPDVEAFWLLLSELATDPHESKLCYECYQRLSKKR